MNDQDITLELTLKVKAPFLLWVKLINKKTISIQEFLKLSSVRISPDVLIHFAEEDNK